MIRQGIQENMVQVCYYVSYYIYVDDIVQCSINIP